jgi:serine/threonine-protein kinase
MRVEALFVAALARPLAERGSFLCAACAGDGGLLREVEELLAIDAAHPAPSAPIAPDAAGDTTEDPLARAIRRAAGGLLARAAAPEAPLRRVGPYRIERELGRGGMSTVYLARRDDGLYRREVALKVVRRGLDTEDVLRRFHAERQILAQLDHPGIARLYDGGTAEDGRPYFVMEAIDGEPIDLACDRRRLSIAERLRLFLAVCAAVSYAHRQLVVHRDIKPSNLLVTGDGTPKLLDFGIAKLLAAEGASEGGASTELTALSGHPMTPGYASPEQRRGEPIGTASDVYSLGVVLYLLLAGHRPEPPALVPEERTPERPSQAAGRPARRQTAEGGAAVATPETIAGARRTTPRELRRRLAGDLDTIVAKALRPEVGRRYGAVEELAEDLRRHLSARPVLARPDTWAYRAGRFLRRNRLALGVAAAFAATVLAFTVSGLRQAARTAVERDKAEQALAFLVDSFEASDPRQARGDRVTAREILDRGAARVDRELAARPETRALLLDTLGRVYGRLGAYERAEPLLRRAVVLHRTRLGAGTLEAATAATDLAEVLAGTGRYAESERLYRAALATRRRLLGGEDPQVAASLDGLGDLLLDRGEYRRAEPVLRAALAMRQRLLPAPHADLAASLNTLAMLFHDQGRYEAAEPLYRQALAMREALARRDGGDHPDVALSLHNLAALLQARGRPTEAEPLLRRALTLERRALGDDHPTVALSLQGLAMVLNAEQRPVAAEALLRQALASLRRRFGEVHDDVATTEHDLGIVLSAEHRNREAEASFRAALAGYRRTLPAGHPYLAHPLVALGSLLLDEGRAREAEPLLVEGLAIRRRSLPAEHWRLAEAEGALGACRAALGRGEEARPLLEESRAALARAVGPADPRTRRVERELARLGSNRPSR